MRLCQRPEIVGLRVSLFSHHSKNGHRSESGHCDFKNKQRWLHFQNIQDTDILKVHSLARLNFLFENLQLGCVSLKMKH